MNGIRTSLGPITTKAKMINKPPCNSGVKFLNSINFKIKYTSVTRYKQ